MVARFIRMCFWGKMYFLGEHFLQLFFSDVLHTLLSADYMYLWCRSGGSLGLGSAVLDSRSTLGCDRSFGLLIRAAGGM